jgi:tetratricopeptide (TPR) repeat protein
MTDGLRWCWLLGVFVAAATTFTLSCSPTLAQTPCDPHKGATCAPDTVTAAPHKTYEMLESDAKANIAKGQFQAALTDIGYLFDRHKPDTVGPLTFMRAEALRGTGDFMRADEAIHAAQNADKDLLQKVGQQHFYFIRGLIDEGLENIPDAQQAYMQAVRLPLTGQPETEQRRFLIYSYYRLAYIASETGGYDQGLDYINNVLRLAGDDGNGDSYFLRGKLKAGLKDFDGAIADYNKAELLKAPGNFHLFRGVAYIKKDHGTNAISDLTNAINDLTISIAAHPDSEASYLNRGVAYLRLTDEHPDYIKLGFADLDQAQKLDKDDIDVYSYRGEFHLFFARKNPKIRMSEASLAAADYQEVLRLGNSSASGRVLYVESATAQLEQINKLLGEAAKSKK